MAKKVVFVFFVLFYYCTFSFMATMNKIKFIKINKLDDLEKNDNTNPEFEHEKDPRLSERFSILEIVFKDMIDDNEKNKENKDLSNLFMKVMALDYYQNFGKMDSIPVMNGNEV
jgi:hypothetical protein